MSSVALLQQKWPAAKFRATHRRMSDARAAAPRQDFDPKAPGFDDPSPSTSNRFKIRIDHMGRIIPEVIPVEEAANDDDSEA